MNPDANDREDRLFRAAQAYQAQIEAGKPVDRTEFLRSYPDLADELLPYLEALDALYGSQSIPYPSTLPTESMNATPLGDYQIVREIGRGGMGIVYEAVQLSLGRKVALKVLPFAGAMDPRQLQRFKNEAQAAAQLHHTNIVPVYAVGCERGVHFYAMQLIEGRTLAEWIGELREVVVEVQTADETVAQMDTARSRTSQGQWKERYQQIARWMLQAAEALDHAHEQGVIHRDIKPANLIIDDRGNLWITDFGLAQIRDGVDLTRTGDLVGTARYMSPEQASGEHVVLDSRTDLYSLGATFYEMLALEPVFSGQSRAEILRKITLEEPRPLRRVEKSIPIELETIVHKCLNKSPLERYDTAAGLAEDLKRYLEHRPIRARRPGVLERCQKWSRRHPGIFVSVGVGLFLSTVVLLISHLMISREQQKTQEALQREQIRTEQVQRRLEQTRQLVELLIQIGEEEFSDRPHRIGLRKRLLETALTHYQELIDDSQDNQATTATLAAARERVQQILSDLITLEGAEYSLLLGHPKVQKDLKLDSELREEVNELIKSLYLKRHNTVFSLNLSPQEKRKQLLEQAREYEQHFKRLLTTTQQQRLKQIGIQIKGVLAFRDPEIVTALKLTTTQVDRIREIERAIFAPRIPSNSGTGGPFSAWIVSPEKILRDNVTRCVRILTSEQKRQWELLIGEPFTGLLFTWPPKPSGKGWPQR